MGGLWFVPGDARRAWEAATAPLFVQWTSSSQARIGPRLASPDVSRFCPQWRVILTERDGGTDLVVRTRLDPLTAALGAFWSVAVAAGGAFIVQQIRVGDQHPGAIGWWLFLVLAFAAVGVLSSVQGGRALAQAEPWFERVLATPSVEDEWV